MGEIAVIALFFLVIVLTVFVFFGWVAFTIVRAVFGAIFGLFSTNRPKMMATNTVRCMTPLCGQMNPSSARFCRRCGHGLPAAQRVQVRRAAVW